jgi:hypothetical protein
MFRLRIDQLVVGEDLTAAQTHLLVGEILERVVFPRGKEPARAGFPTPHLDEEIVGV